MFNIKHKIHLYGSDLKERPVEQDYVPQMRSPEQNCINRFWRSHGQVGQCICID